MGPVWNHGPHQRRDRALAGAPRRSQAGKRQPFDLAGKAWPQPPKAPRARETPPSRGLVASRPSSVPCLSRPRAIAMGTPGGTRAPLRSRVSTSPPPRRACDGAACCCPAPPRVLVRAGSRTSRSCARISAGSSSIRGPDIDAQGSQPRVALRGSTAALRRPTRRGPWLADRAPPAARDALSDLLEHGCWPPQPGWPRNGRHVALRRNSSRRRCAAASAASALRADRAASARSSRPCGSRRTAASRTGRSRSVPTGTAAAGGGLAAHDRAQERAVLPRERLVHERHHAGAAAAEQDRRDRHAVRVLPLRRDHRALAAGA